MKTPASREFGDLISKALGSMVLKAEPTKPEPKKPDPKQSGPKAPPTQVAKDEPPDLGVSSDFPVDGRTEDEVEEMREYGYVELAEFARPGTTRTDGYFCGRCRVWEARPNTMPVNPGEHDGFCRKYGFKDRDFGCCSGWEKR